MRKSGSLLIPLTIIILYYGFWYIVLSSLLSRYPVLRQFFPIGGVDYLASMNTDTFEPVYSSVKDTVLATHGPLRLALASVGAIILTVPVTWVYFITSRARRIDRLVDLDRRVVRLHLEDPLRPAPRGPGSPPARAGTTGSPEVRSRARRRRSG